MNSECDSTAPPNDVLKSTPTPNTVKVEDVVMNNHGNSVREATTNTRKTLAGKMKSQDKLDVTSRNSKIPNTYPHRLGQYATDPLTNQVDLFVRQLDRIYI